MTTTPRLSQVDAYVWRGARPQPGEYEYIKQKFSTVISLEGEAEDARESDELAPVPVVSLPIGFWDIYWRGISQRDLGYILQSISRAMGPVSASHVPNGLVGKNVLVHCEHGEDRTGLVIAAWRVHMQEMSPGQAWAEALAFGYREAINFGLNKTWHEYVRGQGARSDSL